MPRLFSPSFPSLFRQEYSLHQHTRPKMQSAKEKAANAAASAKAGAEKTKATLEEKGERVTTRDPLQKEMATEKKEERVDDAELRKQEARDRNAVTRQAASGGGRN